jgi:hypothetical protein
LGLRFLGIFDAVVTTSLTNVRSLGYQWATRLLRFLWKKPMVPPRRWGLSRPFLTRDEISKLTIAGTGRTGSPGVSALGEILCPARRRWKTISKRLGVFLLSVCFWNLRNGGLYLLDVSDGQLATTLLGNEAIWREIARRRYPEVCLLVLRLVFSFGPYRVRLGSRDLFLLRREA